MAEYLVQGELPRLDVSEAGVSRVNSHSHVLTGTIKPIRPVRI